MSEICPLCNGLNEHNIICKNCEAKMEDIGKMEDYKGPYSPYMDRDSFLYNNLLLNGDNCCIHLYKCPVCGDLEHGSVQLISI